MGNRRIDYEVLPGETRVEVVAFKKGRTPIKKEMTLSEARKKRPKNGWIFRIFQLGFSQFKIE